MDNETRWMSHVNDPSRRAIRERQMMEAQVSTSRTGRLIVAIICAALVVVVLLVRGIFGR